MDTLSPFDMPLKDLNIFFTQQYAHLLEVSQQQGNDFIHKKIQELITQYEAPARSADHILSTSLQSQRLSMIHDADLQNHTEFLDLFLGGTFSDWHDFKAPPTDISYQNILADYMYAATKTPQTKTGMLLCEEATNIGIHFVSSALRDKTPFEIFHQDTAFKDAILEHASKNGTRNWSEKYAGKLSAFDLVLFARNATNLTKCENRDIYTDAMFKFSNKARAGKLRTLLTEIPTPQDAVRDGTTYEKLSDLFFKMCDQPWPEIKSEQNILIEAFNQAENLRITNDDGTDITMSLIDEDNTLFTFCNSVITRNIPGSEIFSSPRRNSANGKIVAKGIFYSPYARNNRIEDLSLTFENGELVDFDAKEGREFFQQFLDLNPNNRFIGEIGLGTNPQARQHSSHGLIVEKISGSFHIALGASYSFTEYDGKAVHVYNGNESKQHWDITTMLRGRGGNIYLDDQCVMKSGYWIVPGVKVLNEGWSAIPKHKRPPHWQNFEGYEDQRL